MSSSKQTPFAIINDDGKVLRSGIVSEASINLQPIKSGEHIIVIDTPIECRSILDTETGAFIPAPITPEIEQLQKITQASKTFDQTTKLPFQFNDRSYDVDRLRFVEVALAGGNLYCEEKASWEYRPHTAEQGLAVLQAYSAQYDTARVVFKEAVIAAQVALEP